MNTWELKRINEVVDVRRGASPRPIEAFLSETGMPWVKISDATVNDSRFIYKTEQFIKENGVKHSVIVNPEDLIISNSATPALPKIMKIKACVHDGWLIVSNYSGITRDFLYYSIKYNRKWLLNQGNGSIFKNLKTDILKEFNIKLPSIGYQNKITKVLSCIDDKIELNNRINTEIEAIAKTLYEYWFVQFDFPNDEGKPYKSSGGKMVWSEELKRDIPDGWKVENIEKCCQIVDCLHSKKPDYCFEDNKFYLLQLENLLDNGLIDISSKYYVSSSDYAEWTSRIEVKENDILITNAGRVAATAQVPKEIVSGIGRNITAIRPVTIQPTYLFLTFRGYDSLRQIKWNTDSGAFFSSFNVKGIKNLYIIRPHKNIEDKFESRIYSLRRKRELQLNENQTLSHLRDWLLPMLMNGQVKVNQIAEIVRR